jgi:CRISPR system Cascade subunit CasB
VNEDPTDVNNTSPQAAPERGVEASGAARPTGAETLTGRRAVARVVNAIARELEGPLSPGNVAALRRLDPGDPAAPAFWRVVALHLEPAGLLPEGVGPLRSERERCWAVLLGGMARCAGLHRAGARLGQGLAHAGLAEMRFSRLLRASGEALGDGVRTLSHQLASSATVVDWAELAELLLSDGGPQAEDVRRRIARDFYGELYRAERPETGEDT